MLTEFVLVTVLTLPNTGSTVYEIQQRFTSLDKCNAVKVQALKIKDPYRKELHCVPADKN